MSEQQDVQLRAILARIETYIKDAITARSSAEIKFGVQMTEGGIRDTWVETKVKVK